MNDAYNQAILAAGTAPRPARRRNWTLLLALAVVALLGLAVAAAPLLAPHDPDAVDIASRLLPPSLEHLLGTDHLGRDVLSRLVHGARVSLGAVALISLLVLALGVAIGGLSGFVGGRVDQVVMRICDVFLTFPTFVLAMFMVGVLGSGMTNVVIAIVLSHWAWYARIVRSLTLSMSSRDYVLAARVAGAGELRIFGEHVLPGVVAQILVLTTLDIGHMMLHVSGLSFLGLGIAPPTAEWGVMINDAREFVWTQPLLIAWPGLAIFLTVMAFNRIGDALRDRIDPVLAAEVC
jgi:nickel transport system permease protein